MMRSHHGALLQLDSLTILFLIRPIPALFKQAASDTVPRFLPVNRLVYWKVKPAQIDSGPLIVFGVFDLPQYEGLFAGALESERDALVSHAVMGPYEKIIGVAAVADYPAIIGNGVQHTFDESSCVCLRKAPWRNDGRVRIENVIQFVETPNLQSAAVGWPATRTRTVSSDR
jgi:hypothetical protein